MLNRFFIAVAAGLLLAGCNDPGQRGASDNVPGGSGSGGKPIQGGPPNQHEGYNSPGGTLNGAATNTNSGDAGEPKGSSPSGSSVVPSHNSA
jgi:hypothetical protein